MEVASVGNMLNFLYILISVILCSLKSITQVQPTAFITSGAGGCTCLIFMSLEML
jgi:hypothetical protein